MTEMPKFLPAESLTSRSGKQRLPFANTGPSAEPAQDAQQTQGTHPAQAQSEHQAQDMHETQPSSPRDGAEKPKASPLSAPKVGLFGRARALMHREKPPEPKA